MVLVEVIKLIVDVDGTFDFAGYLFERNRA